MALVDDLKQQHADILRLCAHLLAQREGKETVRALGDLAATVSVHLAMEDEAMYPRLLAQPDDRIRQLARRYTEEMGGLRLAFSAFVQKWRRASEIDGHRPEFEREARTVVEALKQRIAREDGELYRLL